MNAYQRISHTLLSSATILPMLPALFCGVLGGVDTAQAQAQGSAYIVVQNCNAVSGTYSAAIGQLRVGFIDVNGLHCTNAQVSGVTFSGGTVNQGAPASGTFGAAWPTYLPNGAATITTSAVTVASGAATQIFGALAGPYAFKGVCTQSSGTAVYLGGSGVTSGNTGMLLGGGGTNPACFNLTHFPGALYGTTASGNAVVGYEYY